MRIVALDPGGTTGWAYWTDEWESGCERINDEAWDRGQLTGQHHEELYGLLCTLQPDVLVYERFTYQRRELDKGVSLVLDSVEYIGVAKLWMHIGRLVDCQLVPQTVHQGKIGPKNLWTEEKVKALGLWIPGLTHAMDATGHLLYYRVVTLDDKGVLEPLRPKG